MAYRLTKKEMEALSTRFAELLTGNANARPEDMPELTTRRDWKEAPSWERKKACSDIARDAKTLLLQNGYPKDIVENITRNHIQ